jgi:predicted nucleic-acid-binding Zn-ribbon protein
MRNTHRCPKCQHGSVLFVPRLRDSDFDTMMLESKAEWLAKREIGVFEAWICRECGFTEFYVRNASAIDPAAIEGAKVFSAPAASGTYR